MTGFVSTSLLSEDAPAHAGTPSSGGSHLALATALGVTPAGTIDHPDLADGFVAHPSELAAGLLTVAEVAGSRFYDAAAARSRDPLVTASGDRVRFESMSACNGVYARFDLLPTGIDSGQIAFGTTNVDINEPLRTALTQMRRSELLHLAVGMESLRLATPDVTHIERQVDLPERWVRGLAHVPVISARMRHTVTLPTAAARTFLSTLPRTAAGTTVGLLPTPRGLARVAPGTPGSVRLAGTARVSALQRVSRFLTALHVWADDTGGASAWVADLRGARLTLVVSPEPYRGFSGEGSLLDELATGTDSNDGADDAARLLEHLAWQPVIDPGALATATGMSAARVRGSLAWLAGSGRVGFDLSEDAHFHRELPFDTQLVERANPRLRAARTLVAAGEIRADGDHWRVPGTDRTHRVTLADGGSCTCLWFAQHAHERGPCKHLLAVRHLTLDE